MNRLQTSILLCIGGCLAAVTWSGCGGAAKNRATMAPEAMAGDASPPMYNPRDQIRALSDEIARFERGDLAPRISAGSVGEAPAPASADSGDADAMSAGAAPRAATPAPPAPPPTPAQMCPDAGIETAEEIEAAAPGCREVYDLAASICQNAASICRLADDLPGDEWAAGKCQDGRSSCERAEQRFCTCTAGAEGDAAG